MPIVVLQCSRCSKRFGILDGQLGSTVACAHCGERMLTAAPVMGSFIPVPSLDAVPGHLVDRFSRFAQSQNVYRFAQRHPVLTSLLALLPVVLVAAIAGESTRGRHIPVANESSQLTGPLKT